MSCRVFWIYSDGKRVREVSFEEYRRMIDYNEYRQEHSTFALVWDNELCLIKKDRVICLNKRQLEEILKNGNVS